MYFLTSLILILQNLYHNLIFQNFNMPILMLHEGDI